MTSTPAGAIPSRPTLRLTPTTAGLLAVALVAWAAALARARGMGNGTGTMGMSGGEFLAMWALMMTAMMLPAVAPVASLYARTIHSRRPHRLALFVAGYLATWAVAGIPVYLLLRAADRVATAPGWWPRVAASAVFAAAGLYQLTPLKARCLRHCRSPLAQILHYANYRGPLRDLRVALHHAAFCLGCCWALMLLFVALGVMNVWAMVGLAAVVTLEKVSRHGWGVSWLTGIVALVLAAVVLVAPGIAGGLLPQDRPMSPPMQHMS
jgi:predicted metal-binding membrane protein